MCVLRRHSRICTDTGKFGCLFFFLNYLRRAKWFVTYDDVLCRGQRRWFALITNKVTQNNDKEEMRQLIGSKKPNCQLPHGHSMCRTERHQHTKRHTQTHSSPETRKTSCNGANKVAKLNQTKKTRHSWQRDIRYHTCSWCARTGDTEPKTMTKSVIRNNSKSLTFVVTSQ